MQGFKFEASVFLALLAGAFRKMVTGEVKQLRLLLAQQAAPQLSPTIQLLDGPITAAAGAEPRSSAHSALSRPRKAGNADAGSTTGSSFPALAATSAAAACSDVSTQEQDTEGCSDASAPVQRTFSSMADALRCLGPTADELVKDYAEAYASMKEDMEVRLRHEQRRGDFLQVSYRRVSCNRRALLLGSRCLIGVA